jgi:hypothetical protein
MENGNTIWQDAAMKEMENDRVVFNTLNGGEAVPPDYQDIRCHLILDIKMDDFRHNARFFAGGDSRKLSPTQTRYTSGETRNIKYKRDT